MMQERKKYFHNKKGFTLVELIVVIVIILILAGVLVPSVLKYISASKKAVCQENKHTVQVEMYAAYAEGKAVSLAEAFNDVKQTAEAACPSGGVYTFEPGTDAFSGTIVCSIHDKDETGKPGETGSTENPDNPGTYPGTDIPLIKNTWPTQEEFEESWSNVNIAAGGIFQYTDGNYYVITQSSSITKGQAASGPGGELYGWFNTQKITGRIVTYAENEGQKSDLKRGDICQVGSDYYVYKDGGSWSASPLQSPGQWYKLP